MSMLDTTEWLKVPEAARRLLVCRETIYRWIAAGHLEAYRLGDAGPLRISAEALQRHLQPVDVPAERPRAASTCPSVGSLVGATHPDSLEGAR